MSLESDDKVAMTYPNNIVEKFGGVATMARQLGYARQTVRNWIVRGAIHDHHKPAILAAARLSGIELTEADFFPTGGYSTADR